MEVLLHVVLMRRLLSGNIGAEASIMSMSCWARCRYMYLKDHRPMSGQIHHFISVLFLFSGLVTMKLVLGTCTLLLLLSSAVCIELAAPIEVSNNSRA